MWSEKMVIRREGNPKNHIVMPGMASAHSHAFQRALRGRTQRHETRSGNFWSWRDQMFRLVSQLTPDDVFNLARFAFCELAMSGVTAVGEFHYVHHDVGGRPYANRLEMSEAVIHAAQEAGIRLTLIRAAYFRAGYQQELHEGQKRFCDANVDEVLRDVEALQAVARRQNTEDRIAIAAHSIRACQREQVNVLSAYARRNRLLFHMHVSEQRREDDECLAEYGLRPAQVLAEDGVLDERFVAVHGTHLLPDEIAAMGRANASVCICRTTERDLGDGYPNAAAMRQAGIRLCVGADSHAGSDSFEEVRAIELDDRSRAEKRIVAAEADALLAIATTNGYAAIGMADVAGQDEIHLRADDASLAAIPTDLLTDAVMFGATPRAVDGVKVGGKTIVEGGRHVRYDEALRGYEASLKRMGWL
jgi:formiminoglutamate deiminase